MGRYQKLDRDMLLDAAETLIREDGAHALSIRNIAAKCGVSKGGVQSNFGTVDKLISALFDRWDKQLDNLVAEVRSQSGGELDEMTIFLKASKLFHMSNPGRNAALMILMTQSEERRKYARNWLRSRMKHIDATTPEGRRQRLYFLVIETLLAVKSVQIVGLSDEDWTEVFYDLDAVFDV